MGFSGRAQATRWQELPLPLLGFSFSDVEELFWSCNALALRKLLSGQRDRVLPDIESAEYVVRRRTRQTEA